MTGGVGAKLLTGRGKLQRLAPYLGGDRNGIGEIEGSEKLMRRG